MYNSAFKILFNIDDDGPGWSYRWIPVIRVELHFKEYRSITVINENVLPIRTATEIKISTNEQISVEPLSQDIFSFFKGQRGHLRSPHSF